MGNENATPEPQEPTGKWKAWYEKKFSAATRAEIAMVRHHPITWLKGDYLDGGIVHPWEKLLFGINGCLSTAVGGFNGQDRLFRYTYHVNPNHITIASTIQNIWDFINDPIIGSWMDRHPLQDKNYRWIMRWNHIVNTLLNIFVMLDLGLTPVQHIIILAAKNMLCDILGTFSGVSYTKYFAGITPYSTERGKINVWKSVGVQLGYPIANIPGWIFGFAKDRLQASDYKIYVYGSLIILPLALFSGLAYTFAKHRVDFREAATQTAVPVQGEEETPWQDHKLSLKESIGVLRYNRYLLLNAAASFLQVFTPTSDDYPIRRFLYPTRKVFGIELRGEGFDMIRGQITGVPITFLYPFLRQMTDFFGGPKRARIVNALCWIVCSLGKFAFGYKTVAGVISILFFDTILQTISPVNGYAHEILNYEMLDYVEWKTGVRSEGITAAFNGLKDKLVNNNITSYTHNLFQKWSGIYLVDLTQENPEIPERYVKWAWPLYTLAPVVDYLITLIALLLFPYDVKQKDVIEAELAERRALQKQAAQSALGVE
ncbi:MAG: MFS transporter [Oscillospiraceae bacterium]|jgi:Na+/melibiose symporter-like transporter|nr:MFS transporter [Oscillospiraceae bacterium]